MLKIQKIESKAGEVNYRSKLASQYTGKKTSFLQEPNQKQIISTVKKRLSTTKSDLKDLKKKGVVFSPYLEIGAEFSHRSALLETKYRALGFALDISLESLSMAPFFAKRLKLKKLPLRICADAYNLPFQDNSFNFVFCYQTLHHFPDPKPIIEEIYRVLRPQGHLFINEEPVSQSLNLNLWRRPTKLRTWEKILKYTLILPFVSTIGKTETEHGILEETFSLKTWQNSLNSFENCTVWIKPYPLGPESKIIKNTKSAWLTPNLFSLPFILALGGGIKILAQKSGSSSKETVNNLTGILSCPNCAKILRPDFTCPKCLTRYPVTKNIKLLLDKKLFKKLYPQIKKG